MKGISDIMGNMMRQQLRMWQTASEIGTAMTNAFLAKPGEAGPKALSTLQSMVNQLPTLNAPKTPFNATITRERSYAARTVSLSDAKAIAKASGTKLNDVVMAICAGALRRYLQEKGLLPDKPLIAGVPISLREPGDTRQNNQVSGMLCSIATDIADPVERLKAILKSSSESKQIAGTFRDAVPQDFAFVGAPILLQLIMLVYGRSGLADKLPMPMNVTHLQRARPADAALLRRRQGDGVASGVDPRTWGGAQHHGAELHGCAELRSHRRPARGARCREARRLHGCCGKRAQERRLSRLETLLSPSDMWNSCTNDEGAPMTVAQALRPPSRTLLLLEGRAVQELGAFMLLRPWLAAAPRGDGHPVLVFPGLLASDLSTQPLRGFLKQHGYAVHGWKQGRNLGLRPGVEPDMLDRIEELYERHGKRKLSLVGWSLGGIYARQLAKRVPDKVRSVISLGSPFTGSPKATNAWKVYEFASGQRVDDRDHHIAGPLSDPPPVPTTSIFSRSDGICAWQTCLNEEGPLVENIEVYGSHCGLGHHPAAVYAVADRLAQPEGQWTKFDRSGWKSLVYPDWRRS